MKHVRMEGLFAATITPLDEEGNLWLDQIEQVVEHLERDGVTGLYVCGSTGEGVSLRDQERRAVAEAYIHAARGRLKTFVQVGHNSLSAARELATHAQRIGADAVSATCPSYFKIDRVETLVDSMVHVAAGAPDLPFYYYHIPSLTSVQIDTLRFVELAQVRIPNFAGLKFTTHALHEFQMCLEHDDRRFDTLWGVDEMLLGAITVGARGAVGSTYNIAAPIAIHIVESFAAGRLAEARKSQLRLIAIIRLLSRYSFHAALKQTLAWLGVECGPCRLPLPNLTPEQAVKLQQELECLGFFQWRREYRPPLRRVDAGHASGKYSGVQGRRVPPSSSSAPSSNHPRDVEL